jgi:multidrug efflux pump subunit AcrA (membrane-fusion protein)
MRSSKPNIVAIEQKALTTVEGKEGVFVIQSGRAVPKHVQSGTSYGTFIEIHSGLNIGDSVVVQGVNRLRAGNEVKIVTK